MIKIAFIGAGSVVFSKNLTGDILSFPEFKNATLAYMDVDEERLRVGADLCRKVAQTVGANPTIQATLDRREALQDADFVINMVQIGGFDSTLVDFEIPRKYGLNFTIADTTGPGGLFRALRTFPMLSGLCRDMEEVCPHAILLNYSNPMGMNMQTVSRTSGIRAVGLCHSVQGTLNQLMRYIGEDPQEITFLCAGINHMAFYLKLEKNGVDLYPRLFEAMDNPKIYQTNRVRFELMKRLGYFVTESSEHNAEYSAHFIPQGPEVRKQFDVPLDEYLRRCDGIVDEFERMRAFSLSPEPMKVARSHEYGSTIIHSVVTGAPSVVYGNMPNNGAISNLSDATIVELPTLVDRGGLQFTQVGELPPQLIGYMQAHNTIYELFIRAAMEGRRDYIYQAAMFDPLTAATLTLDQIVAMCDEMIAAHGDSLPPLDNRKSLVPSSGQSFAPPTPQELRASWDAAQTKIEADFLSDWHIIGPFSPDEIPQTVPHLNGASQNGVGSEASEEREIGDLTGLTSLADDPARDTSSTPNPTATAPKRAVYSISLDHPTQVETDFLARGDGLVDLDASYPGAASKWQAVEALGGFINLSQVCGQIENAVAYGYTELDSIHAREALLRCGSDDGIKIWLNGEIVHENETQRGHRAGSDEVPIRLQEGTNRFLVKIDNYEAGWGFSVSVPRANY